MEIEKKFLVNKLPSDLDQYESKNIEQSYIATDPELRLRKIRTQCYLTIKSKGDLARQEFEITLTQEQFENLWQKKETNVIEKERYFIPINDNLIAELDVYSGFLQGLMTVEVEFISEEAAKNFQGPPWFGKDITYDKRFKNKELASKGIPQQTNGENE